VDVTFNGQAAEEKLMEREDYDLVLVDIRTPIMNGKDLYQHMKANHPKLADKVIFTTGDMMAGNTKSFLEESSRPFLPKPFVPEELANIVRKNLK
jgi:CheY-like chemotaxis protein